MKLGEPLTVEASRSVFWAIENYTWHKQVNLVSYPQASTIKWEFPARGAMPPMALYWYDGGVRPAIPKELEEDGQEMPAEGLLFVGDRGKILAGFSGDDPKLIPRSRMRDFKAPPQTLPRPIPEFDQWVRACKGGPASDASFENAFPFAQTILIGTVALRVEKKLRWDAQSMQFTNAPDANAFLKRKYREGWEL
jgi:hypothetical protein